MTWLLLALAVLAALVPAPAVVLAPVALASAGALGAFLVDCLKWPGYFQPPAEPTYPKGWNR